MEEGYIGAYPTFSSRGRKTYRPSNEFCLMRNMTSNALCSGSLINNFFTSVCKEGMWEQFLKIVSLIDSLDSSCEQESGLIKMKASIIGLGQFRELSISSESLDIIWAKDGVNRSEFDGQTEIIINPLVDYGQWKVTVELNSPEIRQKSKIRPSGKTIDITKGKCGLDYEAMDYELEYKHSLFTIQPLRLEKSI